MMKDAMAIALVIITAGAVIVGIVLAGGLVAHSGTKSPPRVCVKGHDSWDSQAGETHHLCDVWTQVSPVPNPMPS